MEDQKEGRGEYLQWSPDESKMLLELAANCFKRGSVDSQGRLPRKTVETKILAAINEKFNAEKTYKHFVNRMKILKTQYKEFVKLLQSDPKFEWNPITKKFTAPDELWNDYLQEHPHHSYMRCETNEEYENMKLIFGNNRRFESSLCRASPCEVGNKEKPKQNDDYDDESMGDQQHDASVTEKDLLRSIDSSNKQMLHLMQTKFMAEEEKKKKVWEAITEIPNLDNNARYKALTEIQKLELSDVFLNMSTEDRLGCIQYIVNNP